MWTLKTAEADIQAAWGADWVLRDAADRPLVRRRSPFIHELGVYGELCWTLATVSRRTEERDCFGLFARLRTTSGWNATMLKPSLAVFMGDESAAGA